MDHNVDMTSVSSNCLPSKTFQKSDRKFEDTKRTIPSEAALWLIGYQIVSGFVKRNPGFYVCLSVYVNTVYSANTYSSRFWLGDSQEMHDSFFCAPATVQWIGLPLNVSEPLIWIDQKSTMRLRG